MHLTNDKSIKNVHFLRFIQGAATSTKWLRCPPRQRASDPGLIPALDVGIIPARLMQLRNWFSSGCPCPAAWFNGPVLRLICPVSVYCDWVRWKV